MSVHDEVIEGYSCPKCKARKRQPCVYLTPAPGRRRIWTNGTSRWEYPEPAYQVGDPMKGTHIERRDRYNLDWHRKKRAAELEAAKASTPPWLVPLREFDRCENEKMRVWLRYNAVRLFRLRQEAP